MTGRAGMPVPYFVGDVLSHFAYVGYPPPRELYNSRDMHSTKAALKRVVLGATAEDGAACEASYYVYEELEAK